MDLPNRSTRALIGVLTELRHGIPPWLVREDAALLARWLERHPVETLDLIEAERAYEAPIELLFAWPPLGEDAEGVARRKRFAEGLLRAAVLGNCSRCLCTVYSLPDGRSLDWPSLELHERTCQPVEEATAIKPPTPRRQEPERRLAAPERKVRPGWAVRP